MTYLYMNCDNDGFQVSFRLHRDPAGYKWVVWRVGISSSSPMERIAESSPAYTSAGLAMIAGDKWLKQNRGLLILGSMVKS